MTVTFINFIRNLINNILVPDDKITCFHCGDKTSPKRTIYVRFNDEIQPVCCNGCASILRTIESLNMTDEYLAHKATNQIKHE